MLAPEFSLIPNISQFLWLGLPPDHTGELTTLPSSALVCLNGSPNYGIKAMPMVELHSSNYRTIAKFCAIKADVTRHFIFFCSSLVCDMTVHMCIITIEELYTRLFNIQILYSGMCNQDFWTMVHEKKNYKIWSFVGKACGRLI